MSVDLRPPGPSSAQPSIWLLDGRNRGKRKEPGRLPALINQMRASCLEYGIAVRKGANFFKADIPRVLANEDNDLSPSMRRLLSDLFEDLESLELRIRTVTSEIEALVMSRA